MPGMPMPPQGGGQTMSMPRGRGLAPPSGGPMDERGYINQMRELQRALMQAQVTGGNPMMVGSLQMQLQNLQQDYQMYMQNQAKQRQADQLKYSMRMGNSSMGVNGQGGGPSRGFEEIMALIGQGGGFGGGGGAGSMGASGGY